MLLAISPPQMIKLIEKLEIEIEIMLWLQIVSLTWPRMENA